MNGDLICYQQKDYRELISDLVDGLIYPCQMERQELNKEIIGRYLRFLCTCHKAPQIDDVISDISEHNENIFFECAHIQASSEDPEQYEDEDTRAELIDMLVNDSLYSWQYDEYELEEYIKMFLDENLMVYMIEEGDDAFYRQDLPALGLDKQIGVIFNDCQNLLIPMFVYNRYAGYEDCVLYYNVCSIGPDSKLMLGGG